MRIVVATDKTSVVFKMFKIYWRNKMKKLIILATLAFTTPALASTIAVDTMLGTSTATMKQKLTDMGYQVRKSEMENGRVEFYVVKGNQRMEIYVNPTTGKITRVKNK